VVPVWAQHQVLYGMTPNGGTKNSGTIFKLDLADSNETVVWNFGDTNDVRLPLGNLIYNPANGLFYGMTEDGTRYNGNGNIFSFNPSNNTENVLYIFQGGSDGGDPHGNLTLDPDNGLYYGMTTGGNGAESTIFTFDPSNNIVKTLWDFGSNFAYDGQYPYGSLIYDKHTLKFYGMTYNGGMNNDGTLFSFDPANNTETVVFGYFNSGNPNNPYADLMYDPANGLYYGMTKYGNYNYGDIFSYKPDSLPGSQIVHVVSNFAPGINLGASFPTGNLIYNPNDSLLYGMTYFGGITGAGTLFSFNTKTNTDSVLWSFGSGTDGSQSYGNLIFDSTNGLLYGLSRLGGTLDSGTIFCYNTSNATEKVLWNFGRYTDGEFPVGSLLLYTEPSSSCPNIHVIASLINDTSAYATALGGTAPYSYVWSTFPYQFGDAVSNILGGDFYTVIATDHSGCTGSVTVNIPCPQINITVTMLSDTSAYAIASGGISPYIFTWGTFPTQESDTVHGLVTGNSYTINVYDQNNCRGNSTLNLTNITSINVNSSISISPNPTTGIISLSSFIASQKIEVYDYLGQKISCIHSENLINKIDLSTQQNGVYLVAILNKDGNTVYQKKIVKQD
jgi:uncharacterized repeat protein (TIGR03803 family)